MESRSERFVRNLVLSAMWLFVRRGCIRDVASTALATARVWLPAVTSGPPKLQAAFAKNPRSSQLARPG